MTHSSFRVSLDENPRQVCSGLRAFYSEEQFQPGRKVLYNIYIYVYIHIDTYVFIYMYVKASARFTLENK